MMRRFKVIICILIILPIYHAGAEEDDFLWVLVEKGKAELRNKEYGNALRYFKEVITRKEEFPEVYVLIGDVYRISDNPIAKEYYKQAYELRHFFVLPMDTYMVLYKMLAIYKEEKNYREYELLLQTALTEDNTYLSLHFEQYKDDYYRIYISKGLNRLLVLHRISGYQHMIKVHGEMGWYFYKTGMYKDAIIHLLFAIVGVISEAYEEVRDIKPLYDFSTVTDFLLKGLEFDYISNYLLGEGDIYKLLYYLGCATHIESGYIPAKDIWTIVAQSPVLNEYKDMARMQIQSPTPEKLLDIPRDLEFEWDL